MSTPPPHQRNTSGSSFRQRLGYYLVGVAIGLVALGFLWSNRQQAVAKQAGTMAGAGLPAEPTGDGTEGEVAAVREYVFVLIRTGPLAEPTPEQMQEAMAGHFANMGRLRDEGMLFIAGPFGEPKPADYRGLWIFNAETVEAGLAAGATDPAVEMGVFRLEAAVFRSADPLKELNRLEKEDEARRLADPDVPDEWQGRGYIVATAPVSETPGFERGNGVLIEGTLVGDESNTMTSTVDTRLVVLDAETPEAAGALLGADAEKWTLHGWYSSTMVAELPGVAGDG